MKGVIELAEDPSRPLVVHGVQTMLHPPARLPAWPDDVRGTRLVLITLDMPEDYVRRMFAAFTNTPVDRHAGPGGGRAQSARHRRHALSSSAKSRPLGQPITKRKAGLSAGLE